MMKRFLEIMLAMSLLILSTVSHAEQLPSPTIQTTIRAEEMACNDGTVPEEDFEIWLEADAEMSAIFLMEIQDFIKTEKMAYYFDDETWAVAAEYLPSDFDMEKLMLAEVYSMSVVHYSIEYGDVSATFEFAVDYKDGTTLLAMIGVAASEPAAENELPEIMWYPIHAESDEGNVILMIPQEVLEMILDAEPAYFILLQTQE